MTRRFPDLAAAAGALSAGGILLLNTDTLPGLHCRVDRPLAVRRLAALKGRPDGKPLLVLAGSMVQAQAVAAALDARQSEVCRRCWPGPFSLILPARTGLPAEITGGLKTVAVRVPGPQTLRELVLEVGTALVSTSVNQAGAAPCQDLETAAGLFGEHVAGLWDDGYCSGATLPSALVDVTVWPPVLLRAGPLELPAFS